MPSARCRACRCGTLSEKQEGRRAAEAFRGLVPARKAYAKKFREQVIRAASDDAAPRFRARAPRRCDRSASAADENRRSDSVAMTHAHHPGRRNFELTPDLLPGASCWPRAREHRGILGGERRHVLAREADQLLSKQRSTLQPMWESPESLWRRLKLGREEFLQRLITTLIVGGDAPRWNTPSPPDEQGRRFLQLLDHLAFGDASHGDGLAKTDAFVDEYLLPKLVDSAPNGWPDWAVLWRDRAWIIELKTEAGSHRDNQLPYYLLLAVAAHPGCRVDMTYITGPMSKSPPKISEGQRYSHVTWAEVLPLVEAVWGTDHRSEVIAYVDSARTVIENLAILRPSVQREAVLRQVPTSEERPSSPRVQAAEATAETSISGPREERHGAPAAEDLLALVRATAVDGRQRGVGATSPTKLEILRDTARDLIAALPAEDRTRFVLPWLWRAGRTGGTALTREGEEFGYELRFSRYMTLQIRP